MTIPEIDVHELQRRLAEGAVLVDVRQPDEVEEIRVPGVLHVPLGEVPERAGELPEGTLLLICRSGARSMKAAEFLAAAGRDVVNVAGGTLAWAESGLPTESGPLE